MDITNTVEKIANYIENAYQIIWSDDELKIFILKNNLLKMLNVFLKESKIELLNSYFNQGYYLILHNQVYQTINATSISLLKSEIEFLKFMISKIAKTNETEELYQLIVMFENIMNIDLARLQYIWDNANLGRTIINDLSLQNVNDFLITNKELQKNLSMKKTP